MNAAVVFALLATVAAASAGLLGAPVAYGVGVPAVGYAGPAFAAPIGYGAPVAKAFAAPAFAPAFAAPVAYGAPVAKAFAAPAFAAPVAYGAPILG